MKVPDKTVLADPQQAMSVAVLSKRLQGAVENALEGAFWVSGEVRDARPQASGHIYFTLADESGKAAIDSVIYKINITHKTRALVVDGARLVVLAKISMWTPRTRVQLVIERVTAAGRGALLEAIERLKEKLKSEGLFERKRPLPVDARTIGVVTSAKGAAIHDIVKVAETRGGANILLCPAIVQGKDAARSIAWSLEMLTRVPEVDVIIVGRGGGSADDLMAYNDEHLVRAVASCRVPVVSAVGHETDVTLVDHAADARAATPSQAAEMVVPDRSQRRAILTQWSTRLMRAMRARLTHETSRTHELDGRLHKVDPGRVLAERSARAQRLEQRLIAAMQKRIAHEISRAHDLDTRVHKRSPSVVIEERTSRVQRLDQRMVAAMRSVLERGTRDLARDAGRLDAMSPLAVLSRGYAIATKDGQAIRAATDVKKGDVIDVRIHEGRIEAEVKSIK